MAHSEVVSAYDLLRSYLNTKFQDQVDHPVDMTPLTADELYGPNLVLFQYSNTHLYAHLRVPIYLGHDLFTMYAITILPVPFHTNSLSSVGYTQLKISEDRLAINPAYNTYVAFKQTDVAQCTASEKYIMCDFPLAVTHSETGSCLNNIWQDSDVTLLKKLCTFMAFPATPVPSHVSELEPNTFVVSTTYPNYHISCNGSVTTRTTQCAFCIVKIPSACRLSTRDLSIYSKMMGDNSSIIIETHAVNLPLALAFNLSVGHLSASFAHAAPLVLHLPDLLSSNDTALPFSARELREGIELQTMALAIQKFERLQATKWARDSLNALTHPTVLIMMLLIEIFIMGVLGVLGRKVYVLTRLAAMARHVDAGVIK